MYEWLKDYQQLKQDIDYLEYRLDREETELKRWVEGDLADVKLQRESIGANVEERVQKLRKEILYKKEKLQELIQLVEKFEGLDNKILRMKWFDGKTLEQIAIDLNYSYNYIKRKHADIMKMIKFADTFK
ncbi:hypothetical protein J32TS6_05130 [Virgibacillus pantothenticus]|uniref:hypothetical protein n=1 Tax=Virgibacillus pantothenticus TaxID=1473 RepID=UPI001B28DAF7|nr:hypothetical protein [Virgibacillus pantothenticus]GIP61958.1 hypothetical protein J32TS6_05130 [Virgibacillus pantothenticus]